MTEFHNIAQAVAFTSHEIALFHALSHSWNVARRPAVIEQWAEITSRNAGLTKDTLASARNKLVQTGVLYFEKSGNRSVPRYSLNALFGLDSPFDTCELQRPSRSKQPSKDDDDKHLHGDLQRLSRSKQPSKCRVNHGVNAASYQVEGKYEEREKAHDAPTRSLSPPPATEPTKTFADMMPTEQAKDFDAIMARINAIHPSWKKRPHFSQIEMETLFANSKAIFGIGDEDWDALRAYYALASFPEDWQSPANGGRFWRPESRSRFIQGITDILGHLDRWQALKRKGGQAA